MASELVDLGKSLIKSQKDYSQPKHDSPERPTEEKAFGSPRRSKTLRKSLTVQPGMVPRSPQSPRSPRSPKQISLSMNSIAEESRPTSQEDTHLSPTYNTMAKVVDPAAAYRI